jgi:hypothetical protein
LITLHSITNLDILLKKSSTQFPNFEFVQPKMADIRKPEASWLSTEVPRFGLMSASRRTPLYQQGLLLPPNRTNWAAALMLDALPGGFKESLAQPRIPQHLLSSPPGSLWLFASARVVLIQAWVAVIHIST